MPTFPECGEPDRDDLCPSDGGDWYLSSYIPAESRDTIRPGETASGASADLAWRTTTGRFDVKLAVCDSGFEWSNTNYVNKIALNVGELPLPHYADGTEAPDYDLDGNGLVNIQDWAEDPFVDITAGRDDADWLLDPSDLIYSFSNGVDDDGNGFVDDIAGWDFFADDNDPYAELRVSYGDHGDGVVEEMAAEGDDGGDIGICPNCSVLLLRTGDGFVTDGHRVAMAIAYATMMDAAVVNMSLGALSRPAELEEIVAWAHGEGVTLVGVAGDENSYHHNEPTLIDDIFYVKSIHPNTNDRERDVYSYYNFFNCNNFGPRLDWSVNTAACATGAAALTTGAAGLLISAARDQGLTLTPDEIRQLLAMNADDIWLTPEETATARTYPSAEGWDFFFGHGRMNVGAAVAALNAGRIPPVARIDGPDWFDTFAVSGGKLPITGSVRADRSSGYHYVVEYARGWDVPRWTTLAEGDGTSAFTGTLAELDVAKLGAEVGEPQKGEVILERMERVFAPSVTVRVTITDAAGVVGQARRTFFVKEDDTLVTNFPVDMGESGESSPILYDLDGDGDYEIIIATAGGRIHAYQDDGTEVEGWPVEAPVTTHWHAGQAAEAAGISPLRDGFIATVAVGDVDGDGEPEVVAASGSGFVYAWRSDGSELSGWPVEMIGRTPEEFGGADAWDNGFAGAPTLVDLDDDGTLEVIVAGMDQRLYVFDYSGAPWGPYPIELCAPELCGSAGNRIINGVAVGDVDQDGDLDLGVGSNEATNDGRNSISYLLDAKTGTMLPGWPLEESGLVGEAALLPIVGEGHPSSLAFADIDGDGDLEISSPVMLGQSPLYQHDGTVATDLSYVSTGFDEGNNTSEPSLTTMSNNVSFGDLDGDGRPEFLAGGAGTFYLLSLPLKSAMDYQNVAGAWNTATGEMMPGWPRQIEDLQFLVAPAVADVTGDGKPEGIFGSAGYMLYAWDGEGELAEGWPKFTGNWLLGSAAVGDLDGDGYVEVVASTREGQLFAWHTRGHADQKPQWQSIHHDPQNTHNYATPIPRQVGPPADDTCADGCCCQHADAAGMAAALGGLSAFLVRRRRAASTPTR
jgi:hypothetical protein